MAPLDLSGQSRTALGHASPIVGHLGPLGTDVPPHHDQLTRGQGHACVCGLGPPGEAPLREALHTQPVALPVVKQPLERRARAVAEHVDGAFQGMVAEHLAAHGCESINAFAKIHWGGGDKDATLGGELEHQGVSKKVRTKTVRGRWDSWAWIRSRAPSGRCRSISMPEVGRGQAGAAGTATKPEAAVGTGAASAAWWATPRFFNSPPRTRNRVATREIENTVVNAMACSQ